MDYCFDLKKKIEYLHYVNVTTFPENLSISTFYKMLGVDYNYIPGPKDVRMRHNTFLIDEEILNYLGFKGETFEEKNKIFLDALVHLYGPQNLDYIITCSREKTCIIVVNKNVIYSIVCNCRKNLHDKVIEMVNSKYVQYLQHGIKMSNLDMVESEI